MADNLSQTVVGLGYVPVDRGDWEKNYQSNSETRYFNDNIAQYKGSAFIADVTAENAEGNAGTEDSPRYYITAKPYEESVEELNPGWKVFASDAEFAIKYFAQFFTEEENPEFCYVIVDKDKKILFGFHWDGEPYFGAGCSQQVKDYINEKLADIVTFLSDYLGSDTTLKVMIDGINTTKVDKEEGKSLIDAEYASTKSSIDNPEFLEVTTDSEDKVLEGIKSDGTSYIGGDLQVEGQIINSSIQQQIDSAVESMQQTITDNFSNIDNIVNNPDNTTPHGYLSEQSNPEWLQVTTDSEGRVLGGRKQDGEKIIYGNVAIQGGLSALKFNIQEFFTILNGHYNKKLFEWGNVENDGTLSDYENTIRIRTKDILYTDKELVVDSIHTNAGIGITVVFYNKTGECLNVIPSGDYWAIPKDSYYRIVFRSGTTLMSLDGIVNNVDVYASDNIIQSANPNIIYQSREGKVNDRVVPPNSKWAIAMASRNEYDRIRFTIRKTSDGYYVCCHDATINNIARTSDGSVIATDVRVEDCTLAQLDTYDFGIAYGVQYAGARIPRLEDSLYYAILANLGVSIESNFIPDSSDVDALYEMFLKYNVIENLILITNSNNSSLLFKQKDERISFYDGDTMANLITKTNELNSLKTEKNRVYISLYPFGSMPTTEFLSLCAENGWYPYFSASFLYSQFESYDLWRKGICLIETANVGLIKTTVRRILANKL